jgi:hypothetical protein
MEELYRKKKNGRYQKVVGYSDTLQDGIWLVQIKPSSTRISSLIWKVGDLKRIADVTTHAALQSFDDNLTEYLLKLTDINSEEYKDAVLQLGSWLKDPIEFRGISPNDLSILILRQIAINIEQTNDR